MIPAAVRGCPCCARESSGPPREPLRAQRDPVAETSGRLRSNREDRKRRRKQTKLGRFLATYGWRAYALPVLGALTGVVIFQTVTGTSTNIPLPEGPVQGPPTIEAASTAIIGAPPKGLSEFDANLPTGMLPAGGPYTEAGARTWHIVPGTEPQVGEGTLKVFSYTIEVEDGIDTRSYGGDAGFAEMVSQTLANRRAGLTIPSLPFAASTVQPARIRTFGFRLARR